MKAAARLCLAVLSLAGGHATAVDARPAAPVQESAPEAAVQLEDVIVRARRAGRDPSDATTECIWRNLPEGQRAELSSTAASTLAALSAQSRLPLLSARLDGEIVGEALTACGGVDRESLHDFVRVAVAAYAVERQTGRALGERGVAADRIHRAWAAVSADQREAMLIAAVTPEALDDADRDRLVSAMAGILLRVRPISSLNPFGYRNGSTNHQVAFLVKAMATVEAMERAF